MQVQPVGMHSRRGILAAGLAIAVAATAVAVMAAISLNTRTASGAGGGGGCFAGPGTGPVCTFKEHVGFADFSAVLPGVFAGGGGGGDCIATDAFVQPIESLTSPGRVAMTTVFVSLSTFNFCTGGPPLECAGNFDPITGAPLFNGTIQFGTDLTTASVNGTAPMIDTCAGTVFTSTINITWQAFGPTSSFIDNNHFRSPGFLMNSHDKGVSRQAIASGIFTDFTGANRASAPIDNASLENDSGGTVFLFHP